MANKKPQNTKREYEPVPFKGFINYTLTDAEKSQIKASGVDHDRLWDASEALLEANWALKIRYDYYNHAYQASLTCNDAKSVDSGWFLVGRGSTPMKALRQALYIGEAINWKLNDWGEANKAQPEKIDD